MKYLLPIIIAFSAFSCSDDEADMNCKVIGAKAGWFDAPNGTLTYSLEYKYFYTGDVLTSVEQFLIETGELLYSTQFNYDASGRLISQFKTEGSTSMYHTYYTYESRMVNTVQFWIIGGDTLSSWEDNELYIENPENSVYHTDDFAYKFSEGNVFEYGSYSVSGTDTTDAFYQRYFYDENDNYYQHIEYRAVIPNDVKWAKVTSDNNVIRVMHLGGALDLEYSFEYDNNKRLTRYVGPSGIAVDFEYQCN